MMYFKASPQDLPKGFTENQRNVPNILTALNFRNEPPKHKYYQQYFSTTQIKSLKMITKASMQNSKMINKG
jgi:hypothetical protein